MSTEETQSDIVSSSEGIEGQGDSIVLAGIAQVEQLAERFESVCESKIDDGKQTTTESSEDGSALVSFINRGLKLDTAEDVKEIVEAIQLCTGMQTIELEGNTIGIPAAKEIGKALESKPTLINALLNNLFISRLKTEIPDALMFLTGGIALSGARLVQLDLSDNAFGPIGMKALAPFLESGSCKGLRILKMMNNGLGIEGGKILSRYLSSLTNLEIFVCGRNRLENPAAIEIGNALSKLTSLKKIEMPQNGIRAEGIMSLATAVQANDQLEVINFNDNIMNVEGGEAIASALKSTLKLKILNLGDCLLKRKGCVAVVEALNEVRNNCLEELILSGNEIGGTEVKKLLFQVFNEKSPKKTLKLDLCTNNFGQAAAEEIKLRLKDVVDLHLSDDEGSGGESGDEDAKHHENGTVENGSTCSESVYKNDVDDVIKSLEDESTSIDQLCDKFVTISIKGFNAEQQSLDTNVMTAADKLLKAIVSKDKNPYIVTNALLIHLGMIKGENGQHKVARDLRGPFVALTNSADNLEKTQKEVLQFFMSRPHAAADETGKIKHKLLQTLYI